LLAITLLPQYEVKSPTFLKRSMALLNDGKAAGTQNHMRTQLILGHLAMLLHEDPQQVSVVGLGSGITLEVVQQHQELKEVDMVEIESAVVEAAGLLKNWCFLRPCFLAIRLFSRQRFTRNRQNFTHRNLKLAVCPQIPKIEAKLRKY